MAKRKKKMSRLQHAISQAIIENNIDDNNYINNDHSDDHTNNNSNTISRFYSESSRGKHFIMTLVLIMKPILFLKLEKCEIYAVIFLHYSGKMVKWKRVFTFDFTASSTTL